MSRRRKRREHHEEHVDESWLLPYADLLTLMVALFIVLFASSAIDAQKFQQISNSFNSALTSGTGIFDFPSPMPEGQMQATDVNDGEQANKEEHEKAGEKEQENEQMGMVADQKVLAAMQTKINTYVENNHLSDKLETYLTTEGLLLTISDNVLFESGSAEVRAHDINIANEIANLLVMDPPRNIIISGHTDNIPIENANFDSNWELSVMRAVNFMKILLNNENLDPMLFSAKGFGEFQPVATNDSSEGRAKNRRVEILITPRTGAEPE